MKELLEILDPSGPPVGVPAALDRVTLEHGGITVHAYGFLHGVVGGPNAEYRRFVQRAIDQAPGIKYGEVGLKRIFRGLDVDLDDYMPVPAKDAAAIGFYLSCHPPTLSSMVAAAVMESLRRTDPFGRRRLPGIVDLVRSSRFHILGPATRRGLTGLPPPLEYMRLNLARRRGERCPRGPRFPDPLWGWLTAVEPHANIPLRSVHMLEFAVRHAQLAGANEASLFVGMVHETDMQWLAAGGAGELDGRDAAVVLAVGAAARRHAERRTWARSAAVRARFAAAAFAGALPALVALTVGMRLYHGTP